MLMERAAALAPPPYADQFQGQLQQQHTNAQQTLVQHETHDHGGLAAVFSKTWVIWTHVNKTVLAVLRL